MEQNILESNKLIAEFMGVSKCTDPAHKNDPCYFFEDSYQTIPFAKYHTSWHWLLPVAHKICAISHPDMPGLPYYQKSVSELPISTTIETLYSAIIKFASWYNKQSK